MKDLRGTSGGGRRRMILAGVAALGLAGSASAELTLFVGKESVEYWESAVETWETMDFTGFDEGELMSEQYEDSLGVVFTPFTTGVFFSPVLFPRDSWGIGQLGGPGSEMEFTIDVPIRSLGFFHPGGISVRMWSGEELVDEFASGTGGFDNFIGLISDVPFDRVEVFQPGGNVSIDDIRLAMQVPAPGALALLAAGFVAPGRRRRSV